VGVLALLLAATVGCKQRVFMTQEDLDHYQTMTPFNLVTNPNVGAQPTIPICDAPPTLYNLENFRIRYLSLAEAVATALEQGTVGQPSLLFPGVSLDNGVQFAGNGVAGDDSIRVLALDPATVGAQIDLTLSKFDAYYAASMVWNTTDQPIGTTIQTIQAGGVNGVPANVTESATMSSGFYKPLPTGGLAGITFNVPYTFTNLPARQNPVYQPQLQFTFDQPLLAGYGVEINQLRAQHPYFSQGTSVLNGLAANPILLNAGGQFQPGNQAVATTQQEGILITRIRFNQQRAEFERNVNQMLLNVETAYWNLYGGYWSLYSREQGLRFAFESWKIVKAQYEAGRASLADFAQAQGQYELFRAQRLTAMNQVLDFERQLRGIMGMQISDGMRLVPADAPTLALYQPDWKAALNEALQHRPELYMARQDCKAAQMRVILAKNYLMPDLRFTATYDANALGGTLSGPSQNNALRNLASNTFNDWSIGLRIAVPVGYRQAYANLRQMQLGLARSYLVLQDQELKVERFLGLEYRTLGLQYETIKANRAQREQFAIQLRTRYQQYLAGRGTLDILLEAQRFWADALAQEYAAIVAYNNALVAFEFAKGTILQHDNINITEGQLPGCVQARAVEHFRERTKALLIRERAAPCGPMAEPLEQSGPINVLPQNRPQGQGQALPDVIKETPPLGNVEELPRPQQVPESFNQVKGLPTARVTDTLAEEARAQQAARAAQAPPPAQPLPARQPVPFVPPAPSMSSMLAAPPPPSMSSMLAAPPPFVPPAPSTSSMLTAPPPVVRPMPLAAPVPAVQAPPASPTPSGRPAPTGQWTPQPAQGTQTTAANKVARNAQGTPKDNLKPNQFGALRPDDPANPPPPAPAPNGTVLPIPANPTTTTGR
jgi:outer membrane protein TolC